MRRPPANITDPVLGGMCFARVLVDFWHPDNLVGQRAAGGGYFRRTLDSHGACFSRLVFRMPCVPSAILTPEMWRTC